MAKLPMPLLFEALKKSKVRIGSILLKRPSFDDVFLH